ncbi:[acyl-carrier-protein] S-malonyltransferase [Aliidiomarina iranensis]|uniref:Malonyl CoA-acyl carrier protein transacylase n=1 Tax=Aliidiomarina iranensis TaxID=1434071 RepID=A0A432W0B8_9GAMM|nr:ACP S-malonyltransferase [Aliidiomarina iranensis]RUO22341.1 [acyl-carrier-protein] S-malonyltransferase [Aliidiomarina iranensis]
MSQQVAYVFPGQGSQTVGMLAELAEQYPQVQATFAEASDVLGYDLWDLVQNDNEGKLNQTEVTQPALLAASVAVYRCLSNGPVPAIMAGHSLGEYSALVCAGALNFADAIKLVELRGKAMQSAVPSGTGAMAAVIGLDDEKVQAACLEAAQGDVVEAVNFNSPGQVVIAGEKDAVARAGDACKAAGAKRVLPLPVSVPSHCALMMPAADALAEALDSVEVQLPRIPVLHNVSVTEAKSPEELREALVAQLFSAVRWTETIEEMKTQGITHIYEIGPGKVLTGLTKRIDRELEGAAVHDSEGVKALCIG